MTYVTGLVYGAGFVTGAIIILAVIKAVFHTGIC